MKQRHNPSRLPFLLSGFLAALAFPPLNLWFISWFALVPLIVHSRSLTFGLAFRRGWWGGLVYNAALLYWIAMNTGAEGALAFLSYVGVLLILPLYWGLFTGLWSFLWKRWGDYAAFLLPAVWVGLEVVKNAPEVGFPWLELGLSQIGFLPVAQLAEIGGIRFVSCFVVVANVAIFFYLKRKNLAFVIGAGFLLLGILWGTLRLYHLPESGPVLKAVIVQGNIDPREKWAMPPDSSLVVYEALTRQAIEEHDPDLILWPETAVPVYLGHQLKYQRRLFELVEETEASLLTGASHYEFKEGGGHDRFNSAFYFPETTGKIQRYDKVRLVPFGERVPFQRWLPKLGELNLGQAEFTPGSAYTVFETTHGTGVSAQICFESVFGQETRHFILNNAGVLCNLTNDAWFGISSGPYQHAALVRFQCISTRRPLLRAANTGISLAADRAGHVIDLLPLQVRGYIAVEVNSGGDALTFYVRHGEMIPWSLSFLALMSILLSLFKGSADRLK
jgi:apolipoprotein N-acyltransferase